MNILKTALILPLILLSIGCGRHVRTGEDLTPGNFHEKEMDWRYGSTEIRIQTTKLTKILMDRWLSKFHMEPGKSKPRLIITGVTNATDSYIPLDMVRDIIESVAIDDGRFTVVVGNDRDEKELDTLLQKTLHDPKYAASSRPKESEALAPQALAKIRLSLATTHMPRYDLEDWRLSITLYDVQTQEAIDSAYDVLHKKVHH